MRIISDFKDYYDVAMALGQDQTLIYNRFKKTEELKHLPFPTFTNNFYSYTNDSLTVDKTFIVGFCGRIYPIISVNLGKHRYSSMSDKESRKDRKLCFNIEEIDTYVRLNFKDKCYQDFHNKEFKRKSDWPWGIRYHDFAQYFEYRNKSSGTKWGQPLDSDKQYFETNRTPIFIGQQLNRDTAEVVYNANLKDVEFYRLFDPFQTYQEISMWLGNQAEPRKPIPEMSDDIKAFQHGYDKWSFRKPPTNDT